MVAYKCTDPHCPTQGGEHYHYKGDVTGFNEADPKESVFSGFWRTKMPDKTPEMVERAAKAIAAERFGTTVDRLHWDQESDSWRQTHIDMALAAIEAMREPTEAMLHAKAAPDAEMTGGKDCSVDGFLDTWDAIDVWRAMVDAALWK